MSLVLGDNFDYKAAKPLDGRLVYSTVASMKAVADSTMYDGCLAYCTATDKTYQWKSTNAVDETTGKWREFTSGGDTIQVSSMPTASASELGKVYQYIGSTTLVYTHGYFYECVSDGEATPTYSWEEVSTSKGGHDIKNDGVAVTARDTMNFTDFDIADDSTNEETDIKAHRLTQAEMTEIMSNPPGATLADGNPVGTVISFMGVNAPYGYLVCDGTAYSITDYQRLADHITNQFGSVDFFGGNGTTTFAVPDLRGEFLRGTGTNSHENQGSGSTVGTHQDSTQFPVDMFGISGGNANKIEMRGIGDGGGNVSIKNADANIPATSLSNVKKFLSQDGTVTDMTSGNAYTTIRPTNTSVLYCIKF